MPRFDVGRFYLHRLCLHNPMFVSLPIPSAAVIFLASNTNSSLNQDYLGLSCRLGILESGVIPYPCRFPCSSKEIFLPLFSLQSKCPGLQPGELATCLKICACQTCQHPGSGKQAALERSSFGNQSSFRGVGGLSVVPTLP